MSAFRDIPVSPSPGTPPAQPITSLRILTYNIAGIPAILNVNPPLGRARQLVSTLVAGDYDIIFLQEAFALPVQQILNEGLSEHYPYILDKPIPNGIITINSGLYIASKHPFKWISTIIYSGCGSDKHAYKGCVGVGLDLGNGNTVNLFTSHTQSDKLGDPLWWFTSNETAIAHRQRQIAEIAAFVKAKSDEHGACASVLVGDLNFTGETIVSRTQEADRKNDRFVLKPTREYEQVAEHFSNAGLSAVDMFRQKNPLSQEGMDYDSAGLTSDSLVNVDSGGESKRLDYCYLINGVIGGGKKGGGCLSLKDIGITMHEFTEEEERLKAKREKKGDLRTKYLSDHAALEIEFNVV
jgi:exonuclease III